MKPNPQTADEPKSNEFLSALQRHRAGGLLEDASGKLNEVVAAVALTGKAGSLTIKLNVKPASRGHAAVVVQDTVTSKVPRLEPEASFWFATAEGHLQTEDPRQKQLPLSVHQGGAQEVQQPQAAAATR